MDMSLFWLEKNKSQFPYSIKLIFTTFLHLFHLIYALSTFFPTYISYVLKCYKLTHDLQWGTCRHLAGEKISVMQLC